MHYYQFNIGDYKSHTEHLSEMEDLTYRRLLDWYYLHETPIPLEINESARQIRMRSHTDCIATVLQEYFERTDNGWIHHRADKEILKVGDKSQKASESAKVRWSKEKNANALLTQSECNATHNTLHTTQDTKPIEKKQRGSRLPNKIENIQEWIDFCNKERPDLTAHNVYSQFRDYWISKAGSGGVKLDWFATWRNWVRSQLAPKQFNNFAQVKADVAKSTVIESADYAATKRREAEEDAIPKNGPSLETLAKMAAIRAKARAVEI